MVLAIRCYDDAPSSGESKRNADPGYFARLTTAEATRPIWIISDARYGPGHSAAGATDTQPASPARRCGAALLLLLFYCGCRIATSNPPPLRRERECVCVRVCACARVCACVRVRGSVHVPVILRRVQQKRCSLTPLVNPVSSVATGDANWVDSPNVDDCGLFLFFLFPRLLFPSFPLFLFF